MKITIQQAPGRIWKGLPVAWLAFLFALLPGLQSTAQPPELLWNMKQLQQAPSFEWMRTDSIVHSLTYKSLDYDGKPTKVFAYYSNPDIIAGKPSSGKTFPGIVLVHGGGGRAFPQWVAKWARLGYAAIAMDLAGKDGYGRPLPDGGPDQSNENKIMNFSSAAVRHVWTYYAIGSVVIAHSLLLSFPEVDRQRTCVTGISWGGYLTTVVAGLDSRFKAAVPVYGCGFLGESDIFKNQLARLSESEQKIWLSYYDPSAYIGQAKMPVLFLNGNKDKHYNVVPFHKTYSLVPAAQRFMCIKPDMKHNHPAGWENVEIALFFEKVWKGSSGLPLIVSAAVSANDIKVKYKSASALSGAVFYYSDDDRSLNEARIWQSVPATIDAGKSMVTVAMPAPYKYAFIQLTASNGATISTEYFIPSFKNK